MAFVGKGSGNVYEFIQSTLAFARRYSVGNQLCCWDVVLHSNPPPPEVLQVFLEQ